MPLKKKPMLVNRGPAGLLKKVKGKGEVAEKDSGKAGPLWSSVNGEEKGSGDQGEVVADLAGQGRINYIAAYLKPLIVPLSSLTPDPENARLHPERNLEAITASLLAYGQTKPLVCRKANRVVVAGNGTLEAAKSLGWTKIAAGFVELSAVEGTGYGLADNRTAELARWDFETVARLDKLLLEAGHGNIGWSRDELEVLRAAEWSPPEIDEDDEGYGGNNLVLKFDEEQSKEVREAITTLSKIITQRGEKVPKDVDCLVLICQQWLKG